MKRLAVKQKTYPLPIFLPDATRAVVKTLDSRDIKDAGIEGVVINTYHLLTNPGVSVLDALGGIKKFMNFDGLTASDSGGWQIFSLIHRDKKAGSITDDGVTFAIGNSKKKLFSPEKAIEVQFKINADIMICLDDFTPPNASKEKIKESVDRTVLWAKRSKERYLELLEDSKVAKKDRPLLFAVVQGAESKAERKRCAEMLLEIGFDGYSFGGYPIDEKTGNLDLDIAKYTANLIPDNFPRFSLGTGSPREIALLNEVGWDIFDCTLPTRDARHRRLYIFSREPKSVSDLKDPRLHDYLYIGREPQRRDDSPISEFCDCCVCKNYSRAYLHHLFNIGDSTAERLATIHNLRTYSKVIELLRSA